MTAPDPLKHEQFLRVSDWRPDERSIDWISGKWENGVSAYALRDNAPQVPENDIAPDGSTPGHGLRARLLDREPKHLVTGDLVGQGQEGEPLLRNIRRLGEAKPVYIAPDGKHNHYMRYREVQREAEVAEQPQRQA